MNRHERTKIPFKCAEPVIGLDHIWICNSDQSYGQISVLSMNQKPGTVISSNFICSNKIVCMKAVPPTCPTKNFHHNQSKSEHLSSPVQQQQQQQHQQQQQQYYHQRERNRRSFLYNIDDPSSITNNDMNNHHHYLLKYRQTVPALERKRKSNNRYKNMESIPCTRSDELFDSSYHSSLPSATASAAATDEYMNILSKIDCMANNVNDDDDIGNDKTTTKNSSSSSILIRNRLLSQKQRSLETTDFENNYQTIDTNIEPILGTTKHHRRSISISPDSPTMWLGTINGELLIYSGLNSVRIGKKSKIELNSAIETIEYYRQKVYVCLANQTVAIFGINNQGYWQIKPERFVNDCHCHRICIVAEFETLWTTSLNMIFIRDVQLNRLTVWLN